MSPPMTARQYKKALARYNLTQGRASWLFGGKTKMSGRRWAAEGAPYAVALLISIMDNFQLTPDDIDELGAPWRNKRAR